MNHLYKPHQSIRDHWIKTMADLGGYWIHDGNPKRPYALLTSGRVSNCYVNCSVITQEPRQLTQAAEHLHQLFSAITPRPDIYCGSAYGAITLAYELARQKEAKAWFTAKNGTDMELDRFEFGPGAMRAVLVEDVITTFKTTRNSLRALEEKAGEQGGSVLPYVFALVNRSGQAEIDGFRIISLLDVKALEWDRTAENPLTGEPFLYVEPVRPKKKWKELTQNYL